MQKLQVRIIRHINLEQTALYTNHGANKFYQNDPL